MELSPFVPSSATYTSIHSFTGQVLSGSADTHGLETDLSLMGEKYKLTRCVSVCLMGQHGGWGDGERAWAARKALLGRLGKRDATETRGMIGGALGHPSCAGDGEPCVQSGGRITDTKKQNLPELGTC